MELMLILAVALPILLGLICYFLPSKLRVAQQALVLLGAVDGLIAGVLIFINPSQVYSLSGTQLFRTDTLNGFIALAAGMFGLLITFYSLRYMDDVKKTARYFGSILCTIGAGFGALLADHLIILLIF